MTAGDEVRGPMSGVGLLRRGLVVAFAVLAVALPGTATAVGSGSAGAGSAGGAPMSASSRAGGPGARVPVFAYFYQWFNPSSWNRAKIDFPLLGRYSSDDVRVLRTQVRQARGGSTGF